MEALRFLFSPSGRLSPQAFLFGAFAVYAAGAASQLLTMPAVMSRGGPWLFAAAQALLIWIWYVLHAKRLHDADRSVAPAVAASILYGLAIILLLILAVVILLAACRTRDGCKHRECARFDPARCRRCGFARLTALRFGFAGGGYPASARFPAVDPRGRRHFICGDQTKRGRPCGVILYFAYGSNMHRDVMATHAPNAVPLGVGALANYEFVITADGYASIEPKQARTVCGVLWRIEPRDRVRLDAWENVAGGLYRRKDFAGSTRRPPLQRAHLYCAATAGRTGEGRLHGAFDRGGAGVAIAASIHCIFAALFAEAAGRGDLAQS